MNRRSVRIPSVKWPKNVSGEQMARCCENWADSADRIGNKAEADNYRDQARKYRSGELRP
jgi:hypothetical protein